ISKDQNSAFNLAQDAVEYVRFARDTNCLTINAGTGCTGGLITASPMWLHGAIDLSPCVSTDGSNVCYFDSLNNTPAAPTQCNNGTLNVCNVIDYDPTNNYFTYSTANTLATIFTRSVSIKYNPACTGTCNPAEADVVVTVSWSDPVAHSIQVNESIYDWQ
ncbi:MAG TPA: hypothetical protein VN665_03455, partial [Candidatus Paceibacterota bacterium]|nr:hypothetical protein [Candidatus Paceibacterota bacterium]